MIVGDTHGNIKWLKSYIYPVAMTVGADRIVVVGDFGAWEHTPAGVTFFNECDELAAAAGIPLYWLHGNHDKFSHTLATYGDNRTPEGFVVCRENLLYIPQGHTWQWGGLSYRAFGGAYSIDKGWRIKSEQDRYHHARMVARGKVGSGDLFTSESVPSTEGTLWFPEEEMTDAEMDRLLAADWFRKDIILSHDKPMSAHIDWGRKNYPDCVPNQLRLDQALKVHKPEFWFHGHFHYHYLDTVSGDDWSTMVVGLDADNNAVDYTGWERDHTWAVIETGSCPHTVKIGSDLGLNMASLVHAKMDLHVRMDH